MLSENNIFISIRLNTDINNADNIKELIKERNKARTDKNWAESDRIRDILTDDEDLNSFLFSLGCYSGESITVIFAAGYSSFSSSAAMHTFW